MINLGRLLTAVFVGLVLAACGGGGGGGSGCEQTGTVEFVYTPAVRTDGDDALTYRLGQANTWTLQLRGVSSACLAGLNVSVPSGRPALPTGFSLDAGTGEIRTGVLNNHVEGYCHVNGSISGPSVNRKCGAGLTFQDERYVLVIKTNTVNNTSLINTPITFQPAP
ncbi:hypothetical protein ASC95_00845 [Pelomonas sp. Root1217]|nr:hypothetical protein ASC95_00845 [Pelomonas sp. Root1217]